MHHVKESQSAARHVGRAALAESGSHPRHLHGADHSAEVIVVRLHNLHRIVGDEPAKAVQAVFLFAEGDRQGKRIGNLLGLFIPVEHHRLFEEAIPVFLQQLADADRFLDRIEPIRIRIQRHLIAKGLSDQGNHRFGSSLGADGMDVGGHEHEPADFDLEGVGVVFGDIPFDQLQGFLDGFFAVFGRLVNGDLRVMDIPDQLAE